MKSTGNKIRARREELGMSRAELAQKLKTKRMRVWRIETGTTPIRADELPAWARALKTNVTELLA